MIELKYEYKDIPDVESIKEVSNVFNIDKYIAAILIQNIGFDINKIRKFLEPKLEDLHDPFLINGMNKAVDIILNYIKNNKKILIYGDYDVDGITGVAVLYNFLIDNFNIGDKLYFKCANRFNEGYGLSKETIDFAVENNINLIITVDCGTKDYDMIRLAKGLGIDIIVTDHHEFGDEENIADVILNNKNKDEDNIYPFKELSGCGIVFKLIQALTKRCNLNDNIPYNYLDLVSLSTSCDLVPLVDENRVLLYYGIDKINKNPQIGIKALLNILNKNFISNEDLLFKVGPCINAPGRISNAEICIKLFITKDEEEAKNLALLVREEHNNRKKICLDIINDILDKIDTKDNSKSTVLYKEEWPIGVLGIIAIRCIEKKNVPTLILTNKDDNYIIGSVRSINGLNILNILESCSEYIERYGGHEMAAGLLLKKDKLNDFINCFENKVKEVLKTVDCVKKIDINIKVPLSKINKDMFLSLIKLAPFGIGNKAPIFMSNATIIRCDYYYSDTFFTIVDKDNNEYIGFYRGSRINITGNVQIVYNFMHKKNIFLNIIDLHLL